MKFYVGGALAAACLAAPLSANETYGLLSLGLITNEAIDNGDLEGTGVGYVPQVVLGGEIANGVYGEVEGSYSFAILKPAPNETTHDGLTNGGSYGLRLGYAFETGYVEALAGLSNGYADEGSTKRYYYGMIAGYDVIPEVSLTGLIGRLDGDGGTDADGLDGPRAMDHWALALTLRPLEGLDITLGGLRGIGVIDRAADPFDLKERWITARYAVTDRADLYAGATRTDMFQSIEDDALKTTRFEVGVTIRFGSSSRTRLDLPNYHEWLADAAGIVE